MKAWMSFMKAVDLGPPLRSYSWTHPKTDRRQPRSPGWGTSSTGGRAAGAAEGAVEALPEGYMGVVVAGRGRGLVEGQDRLARATAAF